jgi:hypothetical protein
MALARRRARSRRGGAYLRGPAEPRRGRRALRRGQAARDAPRRAHAGCASGAPILLGAARAAVTFRFSCVDVLLSLCGRRSCVSGSAGGGSRSSRGFAGSPVVVPVVSARGGPGSMRPALSCCSGRRAAVRLLRALGLGEHGGSGHAGRHYPGCASGCCCAARGAGVPEGRPIERGHFAPRRRRWRVLRARGDLSPPGDDGRKPGRHRKATARPRAPGSVNIAWPGRGPRNYPRRRSRDNGPQRSDLPGHGAPGPPVQRHP